MNRTPDQFEAIRSDCLRRRLQFEDPEFPANDQSIYFSSQPAQKFEWLRPEVLFVCCLYDFLFVSLDFSKYVINTI